MPQEPAEIAPVADQEQTSTFEPEVSTFRRALDEMEVGWYFY
jgi:hypothetical protein